MRAAARSGFTLPEMLVSVLLLSMAIAGAGVLMNVGQKQERIARDYGQAQTDTRSGLRRILRAIRHADSVQNPSVYAFPVTSSSASQVVVLVPEPSTAATTTIEERVYLSGTALYVQRSDQAAPGTSMVTGVSSVVFNYFRTVGTTRSAVDSTPQTATEVQITLTLVSGQATTETVASVALRNKILAGT
jgi:prepilin-type N-terminal cleavage/methylation domain-containing protein